MTIPGSVDFLIVGLGLAGGLLAWELGRRGADIAVIDDRHRDSASIAAAGLVTPVTGKRLVLQENAGVLLDTAHALYMELGGRLGREFLFPLPVLRLLADGSELGYLERRRGDPAYAAYLGPAATPGELAPFRAPYGGAWFRQTGYLDTYPLIRALKDWLAATGRLRSRAVAHRDLKVATDAVRWRDIRARRVVFCEGHRALHNPWFRDLPWQPARGEILRLRLGDAEKLPDAVINWGKWLAPRRDGSYLLGATHEWAALDCRPTAGGRSTLLDSLRQRLPGVQVRVLGQVAAVRPATRDRRPFVGDHPASPSLSIFNGFGARGSLLIPWYARRMADHLCSGAPLTPDADIRRHGDR